MFASRTTQVIPNLARLPGLEQLLPTILRGLPPEVCGLLAGCALWVLQTASVVDGVVVLLLTVCTYGRF